MDLPKISSQELKARLKLKGQSDVAWENDLIRLHRAISWVRCAEESKDNPDLKFIALWIAFNASYADNAINDNSLTEKKRFKEFVGRLVELDSNNRFFELLWNKFSGPIRLLIGNQYAFKPFWDAHYGALIDWRALFEESREKSQKYLAQQKVAKLLEVVLDRLYTVRNQLIHGGATYQSRLNRSQVKDATQILEYLMPIIIDIMIEYIDLDWGIINYPVID